jgi:hypothetical protein
MLAAEQSSQLAIPIRFISASQVTRTGGQMSLSISTSLTNELIHVPG